MKHHLSAFSQMPEQIRTTLSKAKIHTTRQLLEAAALPGDRHRLFVKTGLDEQSLKPWIVASDLCRIHAVSPGLAERLAALDGVDSVQALEHLDAIKVTESLHQMAADGAVVPDGQQLSRLIAAASRLAPRLIWDSDNPDDFDTILKAGREAAKRKSLRPLLWLIGFALFALTTLSLIAMAEIPFIIARQIHPVEFNPMFNQIRAATRLLYLSGWLLFVALMLALACSELVTSILSTAHYRLVHILAKTKTSKRFWLAVDQSYDIAPVVKYVRIASTVFSVAIILTAIVMTIRSFTGNAAFTGNSGWLLVTFIAFTIGMLAAIIIYDALKIRHKLLSGLAFSQPMLMRYLLFRLVQAVSTPLVILAFILAFSSGLEIQRSLITRTITLSYNSHMDSAIAEFHRLPNELVATLTDDPDAYIEDLRSPPVPDDLIALANPAFVNDLRATGITFIVWVLIVITIGYFLVPFLLTRRFKEAAIFVVFTITASLAESLLSNLAESVARLPTGSLVSAAILLFVIVFNAAAFETVESLQEGEELSTLCLSCSRPVLDEARYCMYCGASTSQSGAEPAQHGTSMR